MQEKDHEKESLSKQLEELKNSKSQLQHRISDLKSGLKHSKEIQSKVRLSSKTPSSSSSCRTRLLYSESQPILASSDKSCITVIQDVCEKDMNVITEKKRYLLRARKSVKWEKVRGAVIGKIAGSEDNDKKVLMTQIVKQNKDLFK